MPNIPIGMKIIINMDEKKKSFNDLAMYKVSYIMYDYVFSTEFSSSNSLNIAFICWMLVVHHGLHFGHKCRTCLTNNNTAILCCFHCKVSRYIYIWKLYILLDVLQIEFVGLKRKLFLSDWWLYIKESVYESIRIMGGLGSHAKVLVFPL